MKVKIIKGTKQIGGCMTEIASEKAKILIDFGTDLEESGDSNFELEGLTYGLPSYDAVFITHSHQDHIGLISKVLKEIPVYVEEKAMQIHNMTCDFTNQKRVAREVTLFSLEGTPIKIQDMTITPYQTDHSSYHSCMFLVEMAGVKLLHMGDFRTHGRNRDLFFQNMAKIGTVDGLILEGTTLSRTTENPLREEDIEEQARNLFSKYDQVFVLQSSTNIDRTLSFYRARGKKKIVFDTFTSAITHHLEGIPDIEKEEIYHWDPYVYQKKKSSWFQKEYMAKHNKKKYGFLPNYIMFIKPSMLPELKKMRTLKMFGDKACLLYSMWPGYIKKDPKIKKFVGELQNLGLHLEFLHTSGHADQKTLQEVEKMVNPKKTMVIHTDTVENLQKIFVHYVKVEDGSVVEIK